MYEDFHAKNAYSCQFLIKLEFSRQSFVKYSNIEFHEIPFSVSPIIPCGQTDGHDEANSRFSQLFQSA
jgi:hypothetical protein